MMYDVTREKVEFYQKSKTTVFIKRVNGNFNMGLILECSDSHLILLDRKVGEVFIYFKEILKLEPFREEVKEE